MWVKNEQYALHSTQLLTITQSWREGVREGVREGRRRRERGGRRD